MGGAGGQRNILCHPPGTQLGPPCYQYDDQGSNTAKDVVTIAQCSKNCVGVTSCEDLFSLS